MLTRGGGTPEPAVIRNIHQQRRAFRGEVPNFSGINSCVANKYSQRIPARQRTYSVGLAFAKSAHFIRHAIHHFMNQRERLVLAKGNQVDFVVGENPLPLWVKKQRTVEGHRCGMRTCRRSLSRRFPLDDSHQKWMTEFRRKLAGEL